MPHSTYALIVIDAGDQDTENAWMAAYIDPQGGENTFVAPLTSDGTTISNYWSGGNWYDDQLASLKAHFGANLYTGITPDALLTQLHLQRY